MKVVAIFQSSALDMLRECVPVLNLRYRCARHAIFAYLFNSIVKDQLTAGLFSRSQLFQPAREKLCKCSRRKSLDHFSGCEGVRKARQRQGAKGNAQAFADCRLRRWQTTRCHSWRKCPPKDSNLQPSD